MSDHSDLLRTARADGLRLSGLSVTAGGHQVLDNVDRVIAPGRALLVTGPPASGKSSVLAVCAGEKRAERGEVTFDGGPVSTDAVRRRLGYAPQYSRILDTLTAVENVALPLLADGVTAAAAWDRSGAALDQLDLDPSSWHNLAEQLSGGQRQRVALARVTVSRPALVVVDDPTSELDANTAERVRDLLADLLTDGSVVVLATTDSSLAELATEQITLGD